MLRLLYQLSWDRDNHEMLSIVRVVDNKQFEQKVLLD